MFKHVLTPLAIGPVTVKNRVVRTAHATGFSDGTITDQLIAYHLERAKGGVGLSILEGAWVHESSRTMAANIHLWSDAIIPSYRKLMDAVRPTGMKVFQQLWHGGALYADWRTVPKAPSALPSVLAGVPALEMTEADIQEITQAFVDAARRCDEGGLDGCEIAGSHGYLVTQFLSPWSNQRTDRYGGSLENRTRFLRETLAAIRAVVSDGFAVGLRMGAEALDHGLQPAEMIEAVKLCASEGLLDFVNLSVGGYHNIEAIIPALHTGAGVELNWNAGVKAATGLTTFVSGRFRTLEEADQLIGSGEADMVGMTRATIAEPHLVRKTIEQGPDAPRPCLGCNQLCVGNIFAGYPLQCTVNVMVGAEAQFADAEVPRAASPKNVLIVGGGPAGMEAARVARLAGHRVELVEATPHLGGALRQARTIPHLAGITDILYWLEQQIYDLQIPVQLSSYVEADDIVARAPDVVLLATGSDPRSDGWQIAAPLLKLSNLDRFAIATEELLEGGHIVKPGATYTVVDDTGQAEAEGVAEFILSKGGQVRFVTRFADFAPLINVAWRSRPALRRLYATERFTLHTHAHVDAISAAGDVQVASFVGKTEAPYRTDHILFVGFNHPRNALEPALRDAGFAGEVRLIGDSKSPRYLHAAIHEGFLAGASI